MSRINWNEGYSSDPSQCVCLVCRRSEFPIPLPDGEKNIKFGKDWFVLEFDSDFAEEGGEAVVLVGISYTYPSPLSSSPLLQNREDLGLVLEQFLKEELEIMALLKQ